MDATQHTPRLIIRRRRAPQLAVKDPVLLSACIAEADLTQARLARFVGKSPQFISQLINGRVKGCRADTAQDIAWWLNRDTADLFVAGVAPKQRPRRTNPTEG